MWKFHNSDSIEKIFIFTFTFQIIYWNSPLNRATEYFSIDFCFWLFCCMKAKHAHVRCTKNSNKLPILDNITAVYRFKWLSLLVLFGIYFSAYQIYVDDPVQLWFSILKEQQHWKLNQGMPIKFIWNHQENASNSSVLLFNFISPQRYILKGRSTSFTISMCI